jgi:membrane fusion protein, multidrug efflux system
MIRRIIYFLLATIVLGGLAGGIAWYAFDFKPKFLAEVISGAPRPPVTVSAEKVIPDSWQSQIGGIGSLTALDGIDIAPQVGGVVREIKFDSGQDVKKGQVLLVLDTDTEEADLRSFEAQLANAKIDLTRKQTLVKRGVAPRNDIDALRTQTETLSASIDRTKALISQKSIYAPWDGKLGLREVSLGSFVAPGQKLVWLQKTDPIYVDFTVTEADYSKVQPGQPVTAQFNAWPNDKFTGEIVTNSGRLSDASRLLTVRAKIANADGRLLPGMYANVLVNTGELRQVMTVPQTAVVFSLYGDNVYVVVPATKVDPKAKADELAVERRFIKVGDIRDGRVQIIEGLEPGAQVVTGGQNKIDQGVKIVINNSVALKSPDSGTLQ